MIIYLFESFVSAACFVMMILLIVRAVLSWFPQSHYGRFIEFLYLVTDMILYPVRYCMERLGIENNLPVDISFFITYLLISVIYNIF